MKCKNLRTAYMELEMLQHLRYPDDLNTSEAPGKSAALVEAIQSGNCILITGTNLFTYTQIRNNSSHSNYLMTVLQQMTEWCIHKKIIQGPAIIRDFHTLAKRNALLPLAYKIEEFLPDKAEQHLCIKEILLQSQALSQVFCQFLTSYPFYGYITTTYDTFIEEAYQRKWQRELVRYYNTATQASPIDHQTRPPFIVKLYGDIDNVGSINLSRQASKKLPAGEGYDLLRFIVADSPVLFWGFDQEEADLKLLKEFLGERDFFVYSPPSITLPKEDYHSLKFAFSIDQKKSDKRHNTVSTSSQQNKTTQQPSQDEDVSQEPKTIEIFLSFVDSDKKSKERLEVYLGVLQRQYKQKYGLEIVIKNQDRISAGRNWKKAVEDLLDKAHIILLLISIDFLHSQFCTEIEMTRAIERHLADKARVIPIILDNCNWKNEVFCDLKPLPEEKKPVSRWGKRDDAFARISSGIEEAIKELTGCV